MFLVIITKAKLNKLEKELKKLRIANQELEDRLSQIKEEPRLKNGLRR